MEPSPRRQGPASLLDLSGAELPVSRDYLKRLPDGRLVSLAVQVSDDPTLDLSLAADGWDVIRLDSISIRLRLDT